MMTKIHTKSLCKSFDNTLDILIRPTNIKNNPNKIDNDFNTIEELIFECCILYSTADFNLTRTIHFVSNTIKAFFEYFSSNSR